MGLATGGVFRSPVALVMLTQERVRLALIPYIFAKPSKRWLMQPDLLLLEFLLSITPVSLDQRPETQRPAAN